MEKSPFSKASAAFDESNHNVLLYGVIKGLSPYIAGQKLAITHLIHVGSAHT
jgi:hypothetical protein